MIPAKIKVSFSRKRWWMVNCPHRDSEGFECGIINTELSSAAVANTYAKLHFHENHGVGGKTLTYR